MLRIASNPSATVRSPDGLVLYYFANNRYYHNQHQIVVEFFCLRTANNEHIILSQIQSLEQNIDEFDSKIIKSLSTTKKKQLKARLNSAIQKLNEIMEKI